VVQADGLDADQGFVILQGAQVLNIDLDDFRATGARGTSDAALSDVGREALRAPPF
jgi:hypothetical protein